MEGIGLHRSSVCVDPSEIWRHAYENELSDAGRSLLLAMFSLEGRANGSLLRRAFAEIHSVRARRYGFRSAPEDFRSAMKEVANVFIKPTGEDGFEVIDASVLDLMNAVIRAVPDNAADIISGARTFPQVDRVWALAKALQGAPICQTIGDKASQLAPMIEKLALAVRRVDLPDGSFRMLAPSYERRLGVVIEMLERTGATSICGHDRPLIRADVRDLEN